jgi:hypothetical protein
LTPRLTFSIATRDELRLRGRLVEQRLSHGIARHDGATIEAIDACDDELVALCDVELERLRAVAPDDARVRLVASARRVADVTITSSTMTLGRGGLFVVSDAEHAAEDVRLLRDVGQTLALGQTLLSVRSGESRTDKSVCPTVDYHSLPIVWRHGSASVMLHEAVGHAAEHGHAPLDWPAWLSVQDEPSFERDDVGAVAKTTNLLREPPASFRRESFRDVPLRRMSRLVARQQDAPFDLPPRRIDIHLLSGGAYEPLDETVTVFVAAADFIDDGTSHRLPPFVIRESRMDVTRALAGATGESRRYPGVVCSSEGQELVVASSAPTMLTWFR